MSDFIPIFILLEIVTLPLILYVVFKVVRPRFLATQRAKLQELAQSLFRSDNCEIITREQNLFGFRFPAYQLLQFNKDDKQVSVTTRSGGKNTPPETQIFVASDLPCSLTITSEDFISGIGKKVGLTKEFEVGDPTLDKAFVFQSKDEIRARDLGALRELHSLLQELLKDKKFRQLRFITQKELMEDKSLKYNFILGDSPGILLSRYANILRDTDSHDLVWNETEKLLTLAKRF